MRGSRAVVVTVLAAATIAFALFSCLDFGSLSGTGDTDAGGPGSDATTDDAAASLGISAAPDPVVIVQGATATVTLNVTRPPGSTSPITASIADLPTGATASPSTLIFPAGISSATFSLQAGLTTPTGSSTGSVTATADNLTGQTTFHISVIGAPGSLDTSFGDGGIVLTQLGTGNSAASSVIIQPDQKILVAGSGTPSDGGTEMGFAIARYQADGSLDPSFGSAGAVVSTFGAQSGIAAIAIPADGGILASGQSGSPTAVVALARYSRDGVLDESFGTSGLVTTTVGTNAFAVGLGLQNDGKVVVDGIATISSAPNEILIRYSGAGAIDSSFGASGVVQNSQVIATGESPPGIQSDGKILVFGDGLGLSQDTFGIARFLGDGGLDTTYGSGGYVKDQIANDAVARGGVIQADGKLLEFGICEQGSAVFDFCVARYSGSSRDSTFGAFGVAQVALGTSFDNAAAVAFQSDGKIVVGGYSDVSGQSRAGLVRLTSGGALDTTFGQAGKFVETMQSQITSIAVQADGKIIAVGSEAVAGKNNFYIARFWP